MKKEPCKKCNSRLAYTRCLCNRCYMAELRAGTLDAWPYAGRAVAHICSECSKEALLVRGMCKRCYERDRLSKQSVEPIEPLRNMGECLGQIARESPTPMVARPVVAKAAQVRGDP